MEDSRSSLERLEEKIGHKFLRPELLLQALTHSSSIHELGLPSGDNETLEFLGDAILSMVVAEELFHTQPQLKEGELSKLRARVVRASTLAQRARALELGDFLRMGKGEDKGGGREKPSILSDAFEAVVAALYLDAGLEISRQFILRQLRPALEQACHAPDPADYKSTLQALTQKHLGCLPLYRILAQQGPDHEKLFLVEARIGERVRMEAWGRSKKLAEQEAARQCWAYFQENPLS